MHSTFMANEQNVERKTFIVDAEGQTLGHLAAQVAAVLRGKHKPTFTPHVDMGDRVIIVNAAKVRVSGAKLLKKEYQRYSGYHSGQKRVVLGNMLADKPVRVVQLAVNRMIPSGALGNKVRSRLRIYPGSTHPHVAQKPEPLEIS